MTRGRGGDGAEVSEYPTLWGNANVLDRGGRKMPKLQLLLLELLLLCCRGSRCAHRRK